MKLLLNLQTILTETGAMSTAKCTVCINTIENSANMAILCKLMAGKHSCMEVWGASVIFETVHGSVSAEQLGWIPTEI
uniref:Uncharacterized protein n=1 Tax=Ditylenchus dipsaci TaxID=166011 RepID=A0A915D7D4_9BILA